jgi:hypothetical protein
MTTYVNPFTGQTINPSAISYEYLSLTATTFLQWPINGNTSSSTPTSNIIEVTTTTYSGLSLALPPASQVSTGQSLLIRNVGSLPFTVTDSLLSTVVSASSGVAYYIYLTDNTTTAGTWSVVTFGAGTSAANAATLAGYGLTAVGATLNQTYTVTNYYATATIPITVQAKFLVYNGGAGSFSLPSAATAGANWFCMIRNNGTGILTLTPAGSDLIDGNTNQQLQLTESLVLVSNGSGWNTFAYGRSNSFAYTQLSLAVTGGTTTLTSAQGANTIQTYTGALTSNQIIVVPSTVQLYTVTNNTTGSYTLTVKTSAVSGATITVQQGNSLVLICDGTNVYNAASGSSSSITSLTLGNGSLAVPSLKFSGDTTSGLYLVSTNQVGLVVNNVQLGYYNASGITINGTGTFTSGVLGGTF